jgi:predicted transcriptional regulator
LRWDNLAKRLGVSRQAIENKKTRPEVYEAFHKAKAALSGRGSTSPDAVLRRTLGDEIKSLRETIKAMDRQLDQWAEKWATVEFNAHKHGYDPDLLFAPLPSFSGG